MSIHPSLRSSSSQGESILRSVMKRYERIRHMMDNGTWEDERSVFGLPKIKQARLKTRKGGKAKDDEAAEGDAAAAHAAGGKAPGSAPSAS